MAKTKTSSKKSEKTQKAQKSHRGLKITAVVVAVLLLILGGLATWFFAYYNNPEKVAFDAMNHLFSAENVGIDGGLVLTVDKTQHPDSPVSAVSLHFNSSSDSLPVSSTANLYIMFNPEVVQGEPRIALQLSNVVMKNGVIYFQIGGLMDSLDSFSLKGSEWAEIEQFIPFLEAVDNEWWQIDVNDVISQMELPASQENTVAGVYSCVVEALNRHNTSELAKIYDEHRFVVMLPSDYVSPDDQGIMARPASWNQAYEVVFDHYKLTDFLNRLPETATANEFYACFNTTVEEKTADIPLSIDASSFDEISDNDWDFPENLRVYMEVSTFGHRLNKIYVYQDVADYTLNGKISLNYQTVNVSAPAEYRPITDLIEEFIELLEEM